MCRADGGLHAARRYRRDDGAHQGRRRAEEYPLWPAGVGARFHGHSRSGGRNPRQLRRFLRETMQGALQALLTDHLLHEPYVGQDEYGAPQYGAGTLRPARVEYTMRRGMTAQGQEAVSRARVFFDGDANIQLRDRVTLPDATQPAMLMLNKVSGVDGMVDHFEVMF